MDPELKASRISLVIHTLAAVLAGWVSFQMPRALFGIGIGIVILIAMGFLVERMVKKKGMKWWIGNGLAIYLFFWYISWTFFFNT